MVDGVKYWVKSVRFKVPFKKGTPEEYDTLELKRTFQPNEVHVETVCLLSNTNRPKKESYITLDVEMEDYYRIKNEGKNSTT